MVDSRDISRRTVRGRPQPRADDDRPGAGAVGAGRAGLLSGDIHQNWAAELKANLADPGSATLGAEYVGTSISSDGDGSDTLPTTATTLYENLNLEFFNSQWGYVRREVTPGVTPTAART